MKITVSFDSLDEFKQCMGIASPSEIPDALAWVPQETAQQPQEAPKAAEPKKNTRKQEKPAQEPTDVPEEVMPEPQEAPAVTEDYRLAVRKTLAQLNKIVGKNLASGLIHDFGVSKLTEVKLEDLPALMDKAKEAIDNAE